MELIIAEKPSVARDIARVIGANEQVKSKDITYYKNEKYLVSNVLGHLVTLAEPAKYNEEWGTPWRLEALPFVPTSWQFLPISGAEERLLALGKLMNSKDVESIICATDAGREGEVIFRYVYNYVGCKKTFKRLWISSLTDDSIRSGMKNLLPGGDKDRIYEAGFARSCADWLVGMNLSRLYSIYYKTRYSVGRVQTPTVNMIVSRDYDIANFKKSIYYTLCLENGAGYLNVNNENNFSERTAAESVLNECLHKNSKVIKAEKKEKSENRPLLYSLTSLQKEANEQHGFSAARTLVTMQDLYEKKLFTYPRTDSNYITDDMADSVLDIVKLLIFFDEEQVNKLIKNGLNLDKRIIDNSRVSDHHAIIPTKDIYKLPETELSPDEKVIAAMIMKRLLTSVDEPYRYYETEYIFKVSEHKFKLVTKVPISLGFRKYLKPEVDDLSPYSYKIGDEYYIENIKLEEKETSPPKPFTESTLLSAMENIDKRIENADKKQFVKERGLGTPATRASIIERIIKLGFVERKNKTLVSTEAGRSFISILPEEVKSVEMTADMESLLSDIEKGAIVSSQAIKEISDFVVNVIEKERGKEHISPERKEVVSLGKCPKCGKDVVERKMSFSCTDDSCIFIMWKSDLFWVKRNKTLTAALVKNLLQKDKVLVKGLYSEKTGNKYDAYISLSERVGNDGKVRVDYKMSFPVTKNK